MKAPSSLRRNKTILETSSTLAARLKSCLDATCSTSNVPPIDCAKAVSIGDSVMPLCENQQDFYLRMLTAHAISNLRADSVDPNAPRCALFGGGLGQADHSVLGETVRREEGHGGETSHASYVDDACSINDVG